MSPLKLDRTPQGNAPLCACGCGKPTRWDPYKVKYATVIKGHNSAIRSQEAEAARGRAISATKKKQLQDPAYFEAFMEKLASRKDMFISQAEIAFFDTINDSAIKRQVGFCGTLVDGIDWARRLVIEFNGDYWHCNPKTWRFDDVQANNKLGAVTAAEIWSRDAQRGWKYIQKGFSLLVVWESDLKQSDWLERVRSILASCPRSNPTVFSITRPEIRYQERAA